MSRLRFEYQWGKAAIRMKIVFVWLELFLGNKSSIYVTHFVAVKAHFPRIRFRAETKKKQASKIITRFIFVDKTWMFYNDYVSSDTCNQIAFSTNELTKFEKMIIIEIML